MDFEIDMTGARRPRALGHAPRSLLSGAMKRVLAAAGLVAMTAAAAPCLAQQGAAAAASELDPQSLELARQIIDIGYPPERRREMLMGTSDTMMAQARAAAMAALGGALDPGAEQILNRFLEGSRSSTGAAIDAHSADLFAAFARAYARQFTRDELTQIRAFVATPAGAKYLQRSTELLSDPDVARANTAYMTAVFQGVRPLQEQFQKELTEYSRKHPRR